MTKLITIMLLQLHNNLCHTKVHCQLLPYSVTRVFNQLLILLLVLLLLVFV